MIYVLCNSEQARQRRLPPTTARLIVTRSGRVGGSMVEDSPHDGLVAVVKRDCPTCVLTAPVLRDLARRAGLTVYTQDDPSFPETVPGRVDDTALDFSHQFGIEIVP